MRRVDRAALKVTRENLRAYQATIHLCGGFLDPAYVNDAQAAMKVADAALAKAPSANPPTAVKRGNTNLRLNQPAPLRQARIFYALNFQALSTKQLACSCWSSRFT